MTRIHATAAVAALAAVLLAGGCSDDPDPAADPTPSATPSTTAAATMTLEEACPQVGDAIAGVDVVSTPAKLEAAEQEVRDLAGAGDAETQNALSQVADVLEQMRTAGQGSAALDAFDAWTDAIENLDRRCTTAGASLQ